MKIYLAKLCKYNSENMSDNIKLDDYQELEDIYVTLDHSYYRELLTKMTFFDINNFIGNSMSQNTYTQYSTGIREITLVDKRNINNVRALKKYVNQNTLELEKRLFSIIIETNGLLESFYRKKEK